MNEVILSENNYVVNIEDQAMTVEMLTRQITLIQEVMKGVMRNGEHYGIIPGCGTTPTLLKPGAEKLGATFRFAPGYQVTRSEMQNGHREYEIICTLEHIPTGKKVGQGLGSCSTMESKYRYRKAERVCPKCGATAIIKGKTEYGGGWVCFDKKGGCKAKFKDGDVSIECQPSGQVEHDNPADYYNTVMKMAKKRAHVDAILTATSASDIFTQDIEDLPKFSVDLNENASIVKPEPAKQTPEEYLKSLTEEFTENAQWADKLQNLKSDPKFNKKYEALYNSLWDAWQNEQDFNSKI